MRSDRVEILVDSGTGGVERFEIEATRAGRRIEITTGRGVVEVAEMTRTGRPRTRDCASTPRSSGS